MAGRREKLRRVGIIPEYRGFTPDGLASGDAIDMTVDELEVLRLCDLEGLNQETVAQHMGIARATVAAICSRAHRKVANALVNGRALSIEGGNIAYSPITTTMAAWPAKEIDTTRVATTYDNGNIFMHFGRSEQFKIYDIQDGKVLNEQVVGTGGTGHGALAGLLANWRRGHAHLRRHRRWRYQRACPSRHHSIRRCPGQLRRLRRGPHCRHARADRRGHLRLPWPRPRQRPRTWRVLQLPRPSRARGPRGLRLPLTARHRELGARR